MAKVISTHYVIELELEGVQYHVTASEDLKEIYDIDCPGGIQSHSYTELLNALQSEGIEDFSV